MISVDRIDKIKQMIVKYMVDEKKTIGTIIDASSFYGDNWKHCQLNLLTIQELAELLDIAKNIMHQCKRCGGNRWLKCKCNPSVEGCRHERYPDIYPYSGEECPCPDCNRNEK